MPAGVGVSEAVGTLLAAPTVTVAIRVAAPVQPEPPNLLYATLPDTPVDGNPPDNVADRVVELPTVIGDVAMVARVGVALLTVSANSVVA